MQEKDLKLLWSFTLRIAMYTGQENKETISSFLIGYETGRDNQCFFIEKLSELVEVEYKIKAQSTGWIGQIERVAEKLDTDWVVIFKKQSLRVLTANFTEHIETEFIDSIKKRINGKMAGINHFHRNWLTDWFGIVDFKREWFTKIWTKQELFLLKQIEKELKFYGKVRYIPTQVQPTENLIILCNKMYQEMNKYNL